MSNEFQVRDLQMAKVSRNCAGEILVIFVVVSSKSRKPIIPTISRRIKRDVQGRLGNQEGDTIPELDCGLPPTDVGVEILGEEDRF